MNEMPPSFPAASSKTSALAVCSLVFGILAIVLFCVSPVFAIPAIICGHVAHAKVRRSGGQLTGGGLAIAGFITGYVGLGFMLLTLPIAIPNFIRARNTSMTNMCIRNLRQIDNAKQQWALDNHQSAGARPTWADLEKYLDAKQSTPLKCPAGGTYSINAMGELPTCNIPNHQLQP
jgi:hypothetical protein